MHCCQQVADWAHAPPSVRCVQVNVAGCVRASVCLCVGVTNAYEQLCVEKMLLYRSCGVIVRRWVSTTCLLMCPLQPDRDDKNVESCVSYLAFQESLAESLWVVLDEQLLDLFKVYFHYELGSMMEIDLHQAEVESLSRAAKESEAQVGRAVFRHFCEFRVISWASDTSFPCHNVQSLTEQMQRCEQASAEASQTPNEWRS
eukprot:78012-Amphidinium_carterae.1